MKTKIILLFCAFFTLVSCNTNTENTTNLDTSDTIVEAEKLKTEDVEIKWTTVQENFRQLWYIDSDLQTDTSKTSVDFTKVLPWGPAKDGIPAINEPSFLSIEEVGSQMEYLWEKDYGIAVEIWGESRYYPYAVLVWHEIVNDEVNGEKIAVTFCPLCGSAIVYDRVLESWEVNFWVSGKLYESNMLMYDNITESLWSQNLWEALIWERLWEKFPEGKILSDNTGYQRNYGVIPYGDYDTSDELIFPVENDDDLFPKKEIFYIVPIWESSIAFHLGDLRNEKIAKYIFWETEYIANFDEWIITVKSDNTVIPGYYEMWFSWRTHNLENDNIWNI